MKVPPRHWLIGFISAIGLIGFSAWLILLLQGAREAARSFQCVGNLFQISYALILYHDRHGSLPSAHQDDDRGVPIHSWRASLLIDWEETGFRGRYRLDEPWDGPSNRMLVPDTFSKLFCCPSDPRPAKLSKSNLVAVIGDDTLWSSDRRDKVTDFSKLPSNKILLIELPGSEIGWLEPRDLTVEEAILLYALPVGRIRSPHVRGVHYVSVGPEGEKSGVLPLDITADQLASMLKVEIPPGER
jgi:hypothetical protein